MAHQDFVLFLQHLRAMHTPPKLRIAPTPSGFLHIGNAVNAVLTYVCARTHPSGKVLLRIDDLDADRKRPEYVTDIFETLQWLGIEWDEGPRNVKDFELHWSQRHRLPLYEAMLSRLGATGLVFGCRASRRTLAEHAGRYPTHLRKQGISLADADAAWRVCTPETLALSDFVVRRRDGVPAYQIASLTDDVHFGITHLVRGADLADSTAAQYWLGNVLNEARFADIRTWHHPLLTNEQGEKLSKSAGATAMRSWRATGKTPAEVFRTAGRLLGATNCETLTELLAFVRRLC